MGDRNRFSRWRRLPPVFRSGEHRLPGYEDETHRLTLYLPGSLLDLAQELADLDEVPTLQEYCARLLARSLEEVWLSRQIAQVEAKQGPLHGLDEIADDPNYLSEWRDRHSSTPPAFANASSENADLTVPLVFIPPPDGPADELVDGPPALTIRLETGPRPEPVVSRALIPEILDGRAMDILWRHIGTDGEDPDGFLPRLRRGESVPPSTEAELLQALRKLEEENRGATGLERRLAYALHRVALESQVLLTEAWPGAFDEPTVGAIRSVQEMVERILSGEDVRYYADPASQSPGDEP